MKGKVAIVTGAARGIGAAIAKKLAECGADVAICDLKEEWCAETVAALDRYNAVYAVIPPVTALLGSKTSETRVVAFPELGMEALYLIKVDRYPAIIGAAHGRSIYDENL